MEFNKSEYVAKQQNSVNKFITAITKQGIKFSTTDGEMNNVVFTKGNKTIKMSHHSFYRFSGIAYVYREKDNNETERIEVTDDMYLNDFIKKIVEIRLEVE